MKIHHEQAGLLHQEFHFRPDRGWRAPATQFDLYALSPRQLEPGPVRRDRRSGLDIGQGHSRNPGGFNKALYDNHQHSIVARAYPKSAYITYATNGGIGDLPYVTSLSDASALDPKKTAYSLSTAYDMLAWRARTWAMPVSIIPGMPRKTIAAWVLRSAWNGAT
jgi:hypothetical protein